MLLESALVGSSYRHFSEASETEVQEVTFCAGIGDTNRAGYLEFLKDLGVLEAWSSVIWGMTSGPPTDSESSNRQLNAAVERVAAVS